jgi:hypothetical protein
MKLWRFGIPFAWTMALAAPAHAFCGFYAGSSDAALVNRSSMVVLMRDGDLSVVSMRVDYEGPPENFALVVPVPETLTREQVRTLAPDAFDRIDRISSPRLVEYWERNPCPPPPSDRTIGDGEGHGRRGLVAGALGHSLGGGGESIGGGTEPPPPTVEARFAVDEYEVVILSASDSVGLDRWLRAEGYHVPDRAEVLLRPYVESGHRFFVARVDVSRVRMEDGRAVLSPIRFHYRSRDLALPVRLGLANSSGSQDLIVHVLARGARYEVANRENVLAPTNLVVRQAARRRLGDLYAAIFDRVSERHPGAVITEYAWDAGTCDPCTTSTMSPADLRVLGVDAITGSDAWSYRELSRFVITRLHTKLDPERMSDDLVFRAAPPIEGGNSAPVGRAGHMRARGAENPTQPRFQTRFAILHPWTEPVACEAPRFRGWGGPPRGARPAARTGGSIRASRPIALRSYLRNRPAILFDTRVRPRRDSEAR